MSKSPSRARLWKRARQGETGLFEKDGARIRTVTHHVRTPSPGLDGMTLVFFSDFHWDRGSRRMADAVEAFTNSADADVVVFGGDLAAHSCHIDEAMAFLGRLRARRKKLAVLGNWDKRWRRWMPFSEWRRACGEAGFELLVNQWTRVGGLLVYGFDDHKLGLPEITPPPFEGDFRLAVSHNPDAIPEADPVEMDKVGLSLCGHTHGGQVRIPFFGALKTSSGYWKRLEYGHYKNSSCDANLIVSSGIGHTLLPLRIFCPPEVIVLKFTGKSDFQR